MSIDKSLEGAVSIVIGDRDVLMGFTGGTGVARVWFAPLPLDHVLEINKPTKVTNCEPPPDTVAEVFFVDRDALDGFIELLRHYRDVAWPPPTPMNPARDEN